MPRRSKMVHLGLRIPKTLLFRLDKAAKGAQLGRSEYARRLFAQHLQESGKEREGAA